MTRRRVRHRRGQVPRLGGPALLPVVILGLILDPAAARPDEATLGLADLAEYRAALIPKGSAPAPVRVGFRQLWEHPESYRGRRVQVEGRVVRSFRQAAFGTFPPLREAWAVNPAGDPFCWVFPAPEGRESSATASPVAFVGTFLKLVEYQGGDGARLAPLMVGPEPPRPATRGTSPERATQEGGAWLDWTVGLGVALVVALVLAWQHARRPVARSRPAEIGPAPIFESPEADDAASPGRQNGLHDDRQSP